MEQHLPSSVHSVHKVKEEVEGGQAAHQSEAGLGGLRVTAIEVDVTDSCQTFRKVVESAVEIEKADIDSIQIVHC